jgi:CrcB protein
VRRHASLAALGAVIGSTARYAVGTALPNDAVRGLPWGTLAVNVVGALLIGVLAARPWVMGSDSRRHFMVTGVLGGFTTFSALAVETVHMRDRPLLAAGYIIVTFVAGAFAAAVGWRVGTR